MEQRQTCGKKRNKDKHVLKKGTTTNMQPRNKTEQKQKWFQGKKY